MCQQGNLSVNSCSRNPAIPRLETTTFLSAGVHCTCPHLCERVVVGDNEETPYEEIESITGLFAPLPDLGPFPELRYALKAERQRLLFHVCGISLQNLRSSLPRMQQTDHSGIQKDDTHRSRSFSTTRRRAARSLRTCASMSSGSSSEGHREAMPSRSSTGATPCASASSVRDTEDQNDWSRSDRTASASEPSALVSFRTLTLASRTSTESASVAGWSPRIPADVPSPPSRSPGCDSRQRVSKFAKLACMRSRSARMAV